MGIVKSMHAAIVRQKGGPFQLEEVSIESPRNDEILVQIKAAGICHSDISCRDQIFPAKLPQVFGHEGAGVVVSVGSQVKGLATGDHVVLSFDSCGDCHYCKAELSSYCDQFDVLNAFGGRLDGSSALSVDDKLIHANFFGQSSFAEYAIVKQRNTIKIDSSIDLAIAAPFGCAVQTGAGCVLNALKAQVGQSILIIGAGGVGLSAIMAAKLVGCSPIIAVDLHEHRLAVASEMGATHVINGHDQNIAEQVKKISPGGVDFSVECSGSAQVQTIAIAAMHQLGVCALLGVPGIGSRFDIPCYELNIGKTVRGVVSGHADAKTFLPALLEHYKNGDLPINKWITRYPFEDINQAALDLENGKTIKPVLLMNPS